MSLESTEHGTTWYNVGLSDEELEELIRLIDDDEVDEDLLRGIRRKLVKKRKALRRRAAVAQR